MKGEISIPPLRDLPPGRPAQRREHLLFEITRERGSRGAFGPSRRRLVTLAAAALIVVVAAASALAVRAYFLDRGFIGLPPEGATPSTPGNGELVLAAYGIAEAGRTKVWAYADGRLISKREFMGGEPTPGSANRWSSGLLEQRLTSDGVELLRSEIVSTGLFDDDKELKFGRQPCLNFVQLRNGDPLVGVTWHGSQCPGEEGTLATREQAKTLERLVERLADPGSWLPANAWADRETRAYVPSRFSVCYGTWPPTRVTEPSRIVGLLPAAAADMLRGKDRTPFDGWYKPAPLEIRPITDYCSDMTSDEARTLAKALDDAGFVPFMQLVRLGYRFETPGTNKERVHIYFEPYLPHGEIICSACG